MLRIPAQHFTLLASAGNTPNGGKKMSVSEIRQNLSISYKWASLNLNNLNRVGILESRGSRGQVFYYPGPKLPKGLASLIRTFLSRD